jgi:protein-disulfide isomerase
MRSTLVSVSCSLVLAACVARPAPVEQPTGGFGVVARPRATGASSPTATTTSPAPVPMPARRSPAFPAERAAVPVSADDPQIGAADAPLTVVVFAAAGDLSVDRYLVGLRALQRQLGPAAMRIVWKDYFVSATPQRQLVAELGRAIYATGGADAFGRFVDVVLPHAADVRGDNLASFAQLAGVDDPEQVRADVTSHRWAAGVDAARSTATGLAVKGSPTSYANGLQITGLMCVDQVIDGLKAELTAADADVRRGVDPLDLYGLRTNRNAGTPLRLRSHDYTGIDAQGHCPAWWIERHPPGSAD